MSSTPTISTLLEKNKEYAKTHIQLPDFNQVPEEAKPRILIFCCMDPRVHPEEFLSLSPNDAIIIRNVAGNVPGNLNDIIATDHLIGMHEILVIEHTDCGGTHMTDDQIRQGVLKYAPSHEGELANMHFGTFKDAEDRARECVKFVKNHPLVRPELAANTVGVVYDIKTGEVTPVSD